MTASVQIITDKEEGALYVPSQAIFEDQGYTVVFPRGDLPKPRIIRVGERNMNFVQVLDGLVAGEEVAASDPRELTKKKDAEGVPALQGRSGTAPGGSAGRNAPR